MTEFLVIAPQERYQDDSARHPSLHLMGLAKSIRLFHDMQSRGVHIIEEIL